MCELTPNPEPKTRLARVLDSLLVVVAYLVWLLLALHVMHV